MLPYVTLPESPAAPKAVRRLRRAASPACAFLTPAAVPGLPRRGMPRPHGSEARDPHP
jgi:hypothetical protein